jgi:hypothetical protein
MSVHWSASIIVMLTHQLQHNITPAFISSARCTSVKTHTAMQHKVCSATYAHTIQQSRVRVIWITQMAQGELRWVVASWVARPQHVALPVHTPAHIEVFHARQAHSSECCGIAIAYPSPCKLPAAMAASWLPATVKLRDCGSAKHMLSSYLSNA